MVTTAPPPIVLAHSAPFRVGAMDVRPGTREVIGSDRREVIEPRVMQVLVALSQAGGEILSRDDLITCCWDGRVVGEDAINRVISKVRRLGETVGGGSFRVETITKVGYRLVVGGEAFDAPPSAPTRGRPVLHRRAFIAGGAAALAAGAAGSAWWLIRREEPDVPPEAADFYRQASEALRDGVPEDYSKAVGFLREATTLAPDSAEIWAKLSIAYHFSRFSVPPQEAEAARERALSASRRALEIDPENATAYAALATDMSLHGSLVDSEQLCRRALSLEPRQYDALSIYSRILWNVGRLRRGVEMIEGMGTDALVASMQFRLATLLWSSGRLEEAERVMDRAMNLWPRHSPVWFTRFWLYARTGREREALAMADNRAMRPPGIPDWNFEVNSLCARALMTRSPADIQAAVQANRKAAPTGTGFAENAILTAAQLGLLDEAFGLAEALFFGRGFTVGPARFTTAQAGYTGPVRFTAFLWQPVNRPMRSDPRFQRLIREIGLTDYWRRSATRPDLAAEFGLPL